MATPPNQMGLTGPVQANDIVMRASEIGTTIPGIASLAMKSARKGAQRGVQGIYQLPSGNEPTPEFMNVSQQNLNNQTRQMTDMLNMMAPKDEQLAYINEEEAGILNLLGGSGEMTPQGIPSFKKDPAQVNRGPEVSGIPRYFGEGEHKVDLAYITEPEAQLLKNLDLHDSNPPHTGPSIKNIPNYNDFGGIAGGGGYTSSSGEGVGAGLGPEHGGKAGEEEGKDYAEKQKEKNKNVTGTGLMPKGFVEEEGEDEATAKAVETAKKNKAIMDANAAITAGKGFLTDSSGEGLVSASGAMAKAEEDRMRKAYVQQSIDKAKELAAAGYNRDIAFGYSGLSDFGFKNLQTATVDEGLGNLGDRLGELTAKAKANTISNTELDEMAQLNEFYGKNPTTGMGLTESLRYQFTNEEFQDDITKAAPVLGAVALSAFAPGVVKSIMGINNLMKTFDIKPSTSLRTTIENQLKKLTGKEKKALAKTLPSNYKGFGIQGEDRGQGGDRRAQEEAKRRAAEEEARKRAEEETENNRERDRFERAFANRYFIGPASLDEVRKYAITGGGYNQLTPFYGQEKETV